MEKEKDKKAECTKAIKGKSEKRKPEPVEHEIPTIIKTDTNTQYMSVNSFLACVIILLINVTMITNVVAQNSTFYVSVTTGGSSRSADGSKEKPYKDLQVAMDKAAPNTLILVAEGNYLGTSDQGYLEMKIPVSIQGGYSTDFSTRNVLKHRTTIQPTPECNGLSGSRALLSIGDPNKPRTFEITGEIVIDGIIFDKGMSNGYHPQEGKPEGVETGMLLHAPTDGVNNGIQKVKSVEQPLIYLANCSGNVTIQNCVFINGTNYGIRGNWAGGNWKITNNLFINNAFAAVEIASGMKTGEYGVNVDFGYNTVLFNWSRLKDLGDMGYGYRFMTGVNTDIHHCIIGCSIFAGIDRTRMDTPENEKKRKTGSEDNYYFLNKRGDLTLPSAGGLYLTIWAKAFEDRDELYKYERNAELDGSLLKGKINEAYLEGFISVTYKESTDYNPNSAANTFRSAMGMNQVGTMKSSVTMYANRYPLEDALKLFGAIQDKGVQMPK